MLSFVIFGRAPVGKVEWNITGYVTLFSSFLSLTNTSYHRSVLSSVGNDGQVRLWKAMSGGAWRAAGTIGVEQADEKEGRSGEEGAGEGGEGEGMEVDEGEDA